MRQEAEEGKRVAGQERVAEKFFPWAEYGGEGRIGTWAYASRQE